VIFGHRAGKEGSVELSDSLRKGRIVQINNDTGRIQPEGERSFVFFNRFRLRGVVLNEQGEPDFGSKSTRRGLPSIKMGEEVIFLLSEDEHRGQSVHVFARYADWVSVQEIGQKPQVSTTSNEEDNRE